MQKKQIECAAADLSPAYTKAVREDLLNSVLVYDRFHIMQMLHRTITDCRRTIYRKLPDETARRAIKGSRFILLKRRSGLAPACSGTYRILGAANEPRFRVLARKRDQETLKRGEEISLRKDPNTFRRLSFLVLVRPRYEQQFKPLKRRSCGFRDPTRSRARARTRSRWSLAVSC